MRLAGSPTRHSKTFGNPSGQLRRDKQRCGSGEHFGAIINSSRTCLNG